jgi:hypothetical protein
VPDKAQRVANFHRNTLHALAELLASAGLDRPSQLRPHHLARRISSAEIKLVDDLLTYLEPGELRGSKAQRSFYARPWGLARADRFAIA